MKIKTEDMIFVALFAVLIAICTWISIPMTVPFTLQTFAVFFACLTLGGKLGTLSVVIYILLGAVGLPVFSGFRGGLGTLLGSTGGYIIGFICIAIIMWLFEKFLGRNKFSTFLSMFIGLIALYTFGTAWFMFVYIRDKGSISILAVLSMCVFPFIIPDILKMALAYFINERLNKAFPQKFNRSKN